MKIKVKLRLGIGLLFVMILLLTVLSNIFINKLSGDAKNILADNYNSIDFSRKMMIALNNGIAVPAQQASFKENLNKQLNNITEVGENELTNTIISDFEKVKLSLSDTLLQRNLRTDITNLMLLNMQAIQRKSTVAENTASESVFWLTLAGTICFLLAFTMLVNLPGNIANPIKELTGSIKEIAGQNYSQRVHFEKHNEFGELASAFNSMAIKLETYQTGNLEKLMIEKKRIETLINNMADPVIGLDEHKHVLFMNNIALKITGLKAEEVIGKPVQDIAMQNDLVRLLVEELFSTSLPENVNKKEPLKIYADNKESYFEKEIIPIKIIPAGEKEAKEIGNVILLQNITSYKELDFAKTNFIATVSHELKTPISSIKMSLQLLENKQIGELNAEQQSLVESINDDAGRLLKITKELLNMTQVESGSIQIAVIPSEVKKILDHAISANKTAADNKQIKFKVIIPSDLPEVLADSEKTAWVLSNLLSNAIRYSYENSTISIEATIEKEQIKIAVADSGQGIAPEYIAKVFDRYFRIPGAKKEGTGLGLSISKEFIEAQGGTIAVKSEFGGGSVFSFLLNKA